MKPADEFSVRASGFMGVDRGGQEILERTAAQVTDLVAFVADGSILPRDEMMQQLIAREKEPITPFIDQVRNLYREYGVSTVLVMGGSGEYFEVAETVIARDNYQLRVPPKA
ncbi:MAG: P-loop domain-containing protein [Thermoleophilia bacterium]